MFQVLAISDVQSTQCLGITEGGWCNTGQSDVHSLRPCTRRSALWESWTSTAGKWRYVVCQLWLL